MGKGRRVTDYNAVAQNNRATRTARWWLAPQGVSQKSKVISAIFIGVLLIALLAMYFFSPSAPEPTAVPVAAKPSTSAAPGTSTSPEAAAPSLCKEQKAEEVTPEEVVNATYETVWVRDGDMVRPTSATAGPDLETPYPACFSRTPEGALYATASFATGILTATAAGQATDFITARASHTGNYDAFLMEAVGVTVENRPTVRISGYRWNSYSASLASIEVQYTLVTGPDAGRNTALTYTVSWEDNDWRMVIPSKSDQVVNNSTDRTYIPWGGAA